MDIYPVIDKTDKYNVGDLVSYLHSDSVVPDTEQFHFLSPRELKDDDGNILRAQPPIGSVSEKYRTIKAKKIRGIYSEGIIMDAPSGFQEGDSVIEYFNLTKRIYPEEIDKTGTRECEPGPSGVDLFKYDLEGLAKYSSCFNDGEEVIITEKIEGENCTILYSNDRLWVRSRNYWKKEIEDSYWWKFARENDLENKLKEYPNLALWGELYGGVKNWKYDCVAINNVIQRKFRVFDIYNCISKKFLEWNEVVDICSNIQIDTVPVLYKGAWKSDKSLYHLSEGNSTIGNCVREGFVVRSVPESWHPILHRKIAKLKGQGYKLKKG